MSALIDRAPYGPRDDAALLDELEHLTRHHMAGCQAYRSIVGPRSRADSLADLPMLHVGLFKHLSLGTQAESVVRERTLQSSATTGSHSQIQLDHKSSKLQSTSSAKILRDFLGGERAPLLILDSARSLRRRGAVSARVAAAMSLRFLATDVVFLLDDPDDPRSIRWGELERLVSEHDEFLVYGFSWVLWLVWAQADFPDALRRQLADKKIRFVHSGGWKKLAQQRVERSTFDDKLTEGHSDDSTVLDFYGLVEQVGVVYPLCAAGYRHVPVWADVFIRDSFNLEPLVGTPGQIQLLNTLAWGAPYHNVLTEDVGVIVEGPCSCGRTGKRSELHGRLPKAELRGCANV